MQKASVCACRDTQTHACMHADGSQCALPVIVCGTRKHMEGLRGEQKERQGETDSVLSDDAMRLSTCEKRASSPTWIWGSSQMMMRVADCARGANTYDLLAGGRWGVTASSARPAARHSAPMHSSTSWAQTRSPLRMQLSTISSVFPTHRFITLERELPCRQCSILADEIMLPCIARLCNGAPIHHRAPKVIISGLERSILHLLLSIDGVAERPDVYI
jgi:hypothetical protein